MYMHVLPRCPECDNPFMEIFTKKITNKFINYYECPKCKHRIDRVRITPAIND